MDLRGKMVVITGGSKGLGKTLAQNFVQAGANVTVNARNENELKELAQDLQVDFFVGNVSDENEMKNLAQRVVDKFGRIDVWINNAGAWLPAPSIQEFDAIKAQVLIETNLFGTIFGSRAAILGMSVGGVIVNILSTTAYDGKAKSAVYGADKWGAMSFTRVLREELKTKNIRVLGVFPGGMQTEIFSGDKPEEYSQFLDPNWVAQKIMENIQSDGPEDELVLRRPQ
jgi:NAD(P)-dependent dehydrogenase (short-subunit alcohol dehydrogenase family)